MTRLRLAFMGTPDFAAPALQALVEAGHDIAAVYTRPPRAAGRGKQARPSPIQMLAERHALPLRTSVSLRSAEAQAEFSALGLDAAVVVAYGLMLPSPLLAAPRLGCLNIHASLLPRWRGAAPIQRALLAGDAQTGVTIMQMDEGLDTGPMLLSERLAIGAGDTAGTLHDRLSALGARLVVAALDRLERGELRPVPQPRDGATYAAKLTPADEPIDWRRSAAELERQVRALSPRPGAWFGIGADRMRVLAAEIDAGAAAVPGAVLDDRLTVACGVGALRILRLQRAGRAPMEAAALLRGYSIPRGTRLPLPDPP